MDHNRVQFINELVEKWKLHLSCADYNQKANLAILLENAESNHNTSNYISLNAMLDLTEKVWLKLRLKRHVCITAISKLDDDKEIYNWKYSTGLLPSVNFDLVKESYSDAIAQEIDRMIYNNIGNRIFVKNLDEELNKEYDYVVGAKDVIRDILGSKVPHNKLTIVPDWFCKRQKNQAEYGDGVTCNLYNFRWSVDGQEEETCIIGKYPKYPINERVFALKLLVKENPFLTNNFGPPQITFTGRLGWI